MWMRTTMNYQYRYGTTTRQALATLYKEGGGGVTGVLRFYKGYLPALAQGPLSRFGGWIQRRGHVLQPDQLRKGGVEADGSNCSDQQALPPVQGTPRPMQACWPSSTVSRPPRTVRAPLTATRCGLCSPSRMLTSRLEFFAVPVVAKSACASVAAGGFRILLMPIDALKVSDASHFGIFRSPVQCASTAGL